MSGTGQKYNMKSKWNYIKDTFGKLKYILDRKQKILGVIVFFMSFLGALLETLGVSVIVPLVSIMITPDKLMGNRYVRFFADSFHLESVQQIIFAIGLGVVVVYIVKNLYFIMLSWVRIKFACKVQREMATSSMAAYMKRGYPFFLTSNTGDLLRGINNDILGVFEVLNQGMKAWTEMLTIILICIYIMVSDVYMATAVVILACICMTVVVLCFKKRMSVSGEKFRFFAGEAYKNILQAFQGIKEIIVMRKQKHFTDNYEQAYINQQKAMISQTVGVESPAYVIEAICVSGLLMTVCVRVGFNDNPGEFVPMLASFAVGAFRMLPAMGRISSSMNQIIYCMPTLNAVYENFKEAEEYVKKNGDNGFQTPDQYSDCTFEREVSIENVTWRYEQGNVYVLQNLSVRVQKGHSVALVGPSGAGKTTLADIILGLLIPENGKVTVDGVSIFDIPEQWSRMVGYVPQSVYLIDDTIRNNIAFGVNEEDIDEGEIWRALEQAQMKEFVEKLPEGLDTYVGDRGIRFSGGQRQRVAIARALYRNPQILVLDEATSALDNDTESAVMDAIDALQGQKTMIIVAHRLTTIRNCNEIYEIKDGHAVKKKYEDL